MQTQMNQEDNTFQFEQMQQQVLTYVLSQQIPSSPLTKHPNKTAHRFHQKPKLELVPNPKQLVKEFNFRQANKKYKKEESNQGKIIKIGGVTFKSNFQCGNLANVSIVAPSTYQIELERQSNSNRISAWFYFSVEGLKGEAHLIIKGFTKSSSLYNQGMKVCYRDVKEQSKWRRGGTRITYTNSEDENYIQRSNYELRFSHFFKNNEHTCIQFAYCFPYSLKKLNNLINNIKESTEIQVLGPSFNGRNLPLLTIGNKNSDKVIVLSARVHPGQTVSSFIMEGFIKQLVGDNQYGKLLRSRFLFKIVPMLNPDGVTRGNYRFSGYGCDLNRKWKNCKQSNQPQIYYIRELIRNINKQKQVIMFIDMHGHSRKKNIFFYGCHDKVENPSHRPKQFPFLMEKIHDAYKYQNCCFSIQKDKDGTARIAMWKQLRIDYVYTLEASFCGSEYGTNYLQSDYEKMGKKLCQGITVLFYQELETSKCTLNLRNIQKLVGLKKKAIEQLNQNPKLLKVGDYDDSGSESQPQIGQISQKQRNPDTGLPKPEAITKKQQENKLKKIKISNKYLSVQSIRENASTKIKSQVFIDQDASKKTPQSEHKESRGQRTILIDNQKSPKFDKVQIKIANSINTFQLETLRASSLYQRNVRVHSITRNLHQPSQKSKRVINPFSQTQSPNAKDQRLKMHMIHGREGAQYRRVRKIAEQNMKKQMLNEQNGKMVKQLASNRLQIADNHTVGIAPRFYPSSQQKPRKTSLQGYIRRQPRLDQFKRLSINGDELNVRCVGKHVYI